MKKLFLLATICILTLMIGACEKLTDKIVISIGMWPEASQTDDVAMYNVWKEAFENDYPEYQIEAEPYTYSPDTFSSKANSRAIPTVFQTWFTEPNAIVRGGHAKDITSIVKDLDWYDKLDPELASYLTFDEKLYGIPRDGYGLGLVINLEVFAEAGIVTDDNNDGIYDILDPDGNPRYPTTMQELRETALLIKENAGVDGLIVLNSNKNGGWQFSNYAWNFGARLQIQDENSKWIANLNDPHAVEALTLIQEMRWIDESLKSGTNIVYNDWHLAIASGTAGMAVAGNDVLSSVTTNGMDRNKIAFVPMPKGPNGHQYTLFGGTPYMFSNYATDEQVKGAIMFLEYMGRSPEISEAAQNSMLSGMQTASKKGMVILPAIKPWINAEYLEKATALENQFINVKMDNFKDFFNGINSSRKAEEPYYTQEMYQILDNVLQQIMGGGGEALNPEALLNTANAQLQEYLNSL